MKFHTSLALGFLAAAAGAACSSSQEDAGPASDLPYFPGPLTPSPSGSGGSGSTTIRDDSNPGAPGNGGTAGGSAGSGATQSEMNPDTLAPTDPPSDPPGDTDPSAPPEDEPDEPDPVPPDEPAAPSTRVFLLFGQSNMWGVPNPQAQDLEINARVEVLTLTACGRHGMNQWVPAQPPLHGCVGQAGTGTQGPGVGPGDYFAKTLAAAFPEDTILLVPNAIPGVSIDVFQPGQQAYDSTLSRARMARERGEIQGMIFHQGETDNNQDTWPTRVKNVVDRLRSDLGIGEVPFVAGELLYGGCCQVHNALVNQLPTLISKTSVARAQGFTALSNDGFGNLHFDLTSQREFGRRYGAAMLDALGR